MIYLAAVLIVMGVSLFVSAPLFEVMRRRRGGGIDPELARLEHERALAIQALRELEFDHEMRKLSEEDWTELKQRLEARALRAMTAIEKLDKDRGVRSARSKRVARIGEAAQRTQAVRFCPSCGRPVAEKTNFCGDCGASLAIREMSMTR